MTFELPSGGHHNTWFCDLLPQVFTSDQWSQVVRGFEQRVRAFEMFLEDVYGPREILRQGIIPIPVVWEAKTTREARSDFDWGADIFCISAGFAFAGTIPAVCWSRTIISVTLPGCPT